MNVSRQEKLLMNYGCTRSQLSALKTFMARQVTWGWGRNSHFAVNLRFLAYMWEPLTQVKQVQTENDETGMTDIWESSMQPQCRNHDHIVLSNKNQIRIFQGRLCYAYVNIWYKELMSNTTSKYSIRKLQMMQFDKTSFVGTESESQLCNPYLHFREICKILCHAQQANEGANLQKCSTERPLKFPRERKL